MEKSEWLDAWDARIRQTITRERLLTPGETVLVAVSGGIDSVALLNWLMRWQGTLGVRLVVGHVHHGLRAQSADEDQYFVERLAKTYQLPFLVQKLYWKQLPHSNVQAFARTRRYEALVMMAKKVGAHKIALAHHASDQIETMLFKLLKGTSPDGLSGMPIRRRFRGVCLVRPFLYETRETIQTYSGSVGLTYRDDASNASLRYRRNAIRHMLLPALKTFEPTVESHLLTLSEQLKDDARFFRTLGIRFLQKHSTFAPGIWDVSSASLKKLSPSLQRRVIHLIWSYLQRSPDTKHAVLTFTHIEHIRSLLMEEESFAISLPGTVELWARKGRLIGYTEPPRLSEVHLFPGSVVSWPGTTLSVALLPVQRVPRTMMGAWSGVTDERWPAFLFLDDSAFSRIGKLTLRTFRAGDRFFDRPNKKIKDAWEALGIERPWRARWPLVTAMGRIVWAPPFFLKEHGVKDGTAEQAGTEVTPVPVESGQGYMLFALKRAYPWPWGDEDATESEGHVQGHVKEG